MKLIVPSLWFFLDKEKTLAIQVLKLKSGIYCWLVGELLAHQEMSVIKILYMH
jgi:hypothetical protein